MVSGQQVMQWVRCTSINNSLSLSDITLSLSIDLYETGNKSLIV